MKKIYKLLSVFLTVVFVLAAFSPAVMAEALETDGVVSEAAVSEDRTLTEEAYGAEGALQESEEEPKVSESVEEENLEAQLQDSDAEQDGEPALNEEPTVLSEMPQGETEYEPDGENENLVSSGESYINLEEKEFLSSGTYKFYREITDVKQEYRDGATWKTLTTGSYSWQMDAIRLVTNSKYYYFEYKARYKSSYNWLPEVNSTDTSDYAGVYGKPITNVAIKVFNTVNNRYDDCDYVVMYRAMAGNEWCSWVSNASPDVMRIIKNEYGLSGELDTSGTNAGDATLGVINAIQIRVFERTGVTPDSTAKIIDAPYYNQKAIGLPNGCEAVSAVMALNCFNYSLNPETFVNTYLDCGALNTDPAVNYVGDPHLTGGNGWGCYSPVIKKDIDKVIDKTKHICKDISGTSMSELCTRYIDRGVPVVVWTTTFLMTENCTYSGWTTPEGKYISYNKKQHCMLLVGYDTNYYYFNDPLTNVGNRKYIGYPKALFEESYALMNKQAVVIDSASASGISITEMPAKTVYILGEELDATGLCVVITYPSGETENVTDYALGSVDTSSVGDKQVSVTWTDVTGKTLSASFTVTVIDTEPALTGITITLKDGKNIYEIGQDFDFDSVSAVAVWETKSIGDDGKVLVDIHEEAITEGYEISGYDPNTAGTQTLTFSYLGVTETFEVTVSAEHIAGEAFAEKEPTCTEKGCLVTLCSLCNEEIGREDIGPLGHDFSEEYTVDIEADYTSEGEMSRHCVRCDERCDITPIDRLISDIRGDANGDGLVTLKDVLLLRRVVAGVATLPEVYADNADVNRDGIVTLKDILLLRKVVAGVATL